MNLAGWARLLVVLFSETALLFAVAALLQLSLRSPRASCALWQTSLVTVTLLWFVQLSGLPDVMAKSDSQNHHFLITAATLPLSSTRPATAASVASKDPSSAPSRELAKWPLGLWLSGSALLLAASIAARISIFVRNRSGTFADEESIRMLVHWKNLLGLPRLRSCIWPGLRAPVAFGIFNPTIALPPDFTSRYSAIEREAMLAHEMAHLAARDPFWLLVSELATVLAWWHPLVWWARRRLQAANETAADEASALIPGGRQALAECLVQLGRELSAPALGRVMGVGGNGLHSQLARRVQRLLQEGSVWRPLSSRLRWTPPLSALAIALAAMMLPIQTGLSGSILAVLMPVTIAPTPAASALRSTATAASSTLSTNQQFVAAPQDSAAFTVSGNGSAPLSYQWQLNNSDSPNASSAASNSGTRADVSSTSIRAIEQGPKINLSSQILIVTEHSAEDIGLDWVFGKAPEDDAPMQTSHDPVAAELTKAPPSFPEDQTNLLIDCFRTSGQSAILSAGQFAALSNRIAGRNVSFLKSPSLLTQSGREGIVSVRDEMSVVMGAHATLSSSSNPDAGVAYSTEEFGLGFSIRILPSVEMGEKWRLQVHAGQTAFIGYDDYGKNLGTLSNPGGKPIHYTVPHPHFRLVQTDSDDVLAVGQILALRGPIWTEETHTAGHFLSSAKTTSERKRLYVFITPEPLP